MGESSGGGSYSSRTTTKLLVLFLALISCSSVVGCFPSFPIPGITTVRTKSNVLNGSACAFADFNFDLATDVVLMTGPRTLSVALASPSEPNFRQDVLSPIQLAGTEDDGTIIGCAVANLDSHDTLPDLLVTTARDERYDVFVCLAKLGDRDGLLNFDCNKFEFPQNGKLAAEPSVFNFDLRSPYANIVGVASDGRLLCGKVGSRAAQYRLLDKSLPPDECTALVHLGEGRKLDPVHSVIGFADLDGDLNADIFLGLKTGAEGTKFAVFQTHLDKEKNTMVWNATSSAEESPSWDGKVGVPVIDDFDGDGKADVIVPTCSGDDNEKCTLWLRSGSTGSWLEVPINFAPDAESRYRPASEDGHRILPLRSGDFYLSGYPALLVLLSKVGEGKHDSPAPFLLKNVPCTEGECGWTREFVVVWDSPIGDLGLAGHRVTLASFFDLEEDGVLDVLIEYESDGKKLTRVFGRNNKDGSDTTFLKVGVCSAVCSADCPKRLGSGVYAAGATVRFETVDSLSKTVRGVHSQLSRTAGRPLELPFCLFGLGRSPNFVEQVQVGSPSFPPANHTLVQIIPNSRLYVVPPPKAGKGRGGWVSRLYVTPNRLIAKSLVVLLAVCAVILLIIAWLQWRETRQDQIDRRKAAHRFHFDAM